MSKRHFAFIAAGCIGLAPLAATAQDRMPADGLTLDQARLMDADRNGAITEEEFLAESADRDLFALLDANFDGVLDVEEQRLAIRIPVRTTR